MSNIYEEIAKFAECEKKEAQKALQEEKNQVCIKADSYIAKEVKYQTALLHQILNKLNERSLSEKKGNKKMFPIFQITKDFQRQMRMNQKCHVVY